MQVTTPNGAWTVGAKNNDCGILCNFHLSANGQQHQKFLASVKSTIDDDMPATT